jgi:hypothetical protein
MTVMPERRLPWSTHESAPPRTVDPIVKRMSIADLESDLRTIARQREDLRETEAQIRFEIEAKRREQKRWNDADLDDPETRTALAEGEADARAGRVRPYEDVRRDLGLSG